MIPAASSAADLLSLLERETALRRVAATDGGEYAGACPFCGGRDRFHVWPHAARPHYWCRTCGQRGDAIQYLRDRHGLSFPEAKRRLGLPVDALPRAHVAPVVAPVRRDEEPPSARWQAAARAFTEQARAILWSAAGAQALAYLREKRGLTDETIRAAGLGYCPRGARVPAPPWGLTGEGLWLPRGVTIPCDVDGVFWYLKVRRPRAADPLSGAADELADYVGADVRWKDGSSGPKYLGLRGGRPALFGAGALTGKALAVLTEGELDALLLRQQAGDLVDVVTLGSASLPLAGRWLWALRDASRIIAAYDADGAGASAGAKASLRSARVRVARPLDGKDLTDMHLAGGDLCAWASYLLEHYLPTSPSSGLAEECSICATPVYCYGPDGTPYCEQHSPQEEHKNV